MSDFEIENKPPVKTFAPVELDITLKTPEMLAALKTVAAGHADVASLCSPTDREQWRVISSFFKSLRDILEQVEQ